MTTNQKDGSNLHIYRKGNKADTKRFRNTNVRVAYTTKNNLGKLLNLKLQDTQQPDKYNKS